MGSGSRADSRPDCCADASGVGRPLPGAGGDVDLAVAIFCPSWNSLARPCPLEASAAEGSTFSCTAPACPAIAHLRDRRLEWRVEPKSGGGAGPGCGGLWLRRMQLLLACSRPVASAGQEDRAGGRPAA